MTALLAAVAAALAVALVVVELDRRRSARRLAGLAQRLDPELQADGGGLGAAVSLVERGVGRVDQRTGELRGATRRLERALDALPAGVVLFDGAGEVIHRNDAAATYRATHRGDVLVEEAIAKLAAAAAGGATPPRRVVEVLGPPPRTVVVRAARLAGGVDGVLVIAEDISDRRRLEAIRRDFVANISHELKTPIGALTLLAETFVDEDDPAVARRLAGRIVREAIRVGRTIDDLLELSRIEGAELRSVEAVALDAVISEAADRIRHNADQRGITLSVDAPHGLVVTGERLQLVSAVANLLDNAVKYSDGGSTVEVRTTRDDDAVEIAVTDHGVGIPRADLDRVFERFYRVDRARSRETGGTGLGLAIVRHIAANHGGEVRLESQEGLGSTFTLRLPAEPGATAGTEQERMSS